MDIDLAALPDDVETLQNLVRSLAAERASLSEAKAEIERLNLIIKKLQRSQFGRRTERIDDDQLQLGLEDLNTDLARVEAGLPLPTTEAETPKAQCERPSLPAHLAREHFHLDVEHEAWDSTQQLDVVHHVPVWQRQNEVGFSTVTDNAGATIRR